MSSRWKYLTGTLVLLVLAYALIIAGQILLGVIAAIGIYGTGWLFATFRPDDGYIEALGWGRVTVLTLIALVSLSYAVVIANQILLGVVVVCLVALVGFASAPGGPTSRIAEFYRAVLRIDRHLREREGELTDGGLDDPSTTDDTDDEVGRERERDD